MPKKISVKAKETRIEYQDPFRLYMNLSDKGNNISLLMESRSLNLQYGRESLIVPNPAVRITGKKERFKIEALTESGRRLVGLFSGQDFPYAEDYLQRGGVIEGEVRSIEKKDFDEKKRTGLQNISFMLKTIMQKMDCESGYAGLYGAFAYDFARNFYPAGERPEREDGPDFVLFIPSSVYVFDDIRQKAVKIEFEFNGISGRSDSPNKGFDFARKKGGAEYDMTDDEYLLKAGKIIRDIKEGRAMQCVLSRRAKTALQKHPVESYARLRDVNPSPYSFYYNLGDNEILYGASPEMHICINDKEIEIRPIAGTIARSGNPLEDARNRIALLMDEKETREHAMLVDLARHELYALSETDSMHIKELFSIEEYPNLYHLVSGIKARLRGDTNAVDAMLVTLPAGTLCGAPKTEAMRMIDEYESSGRGFYGGAVGFLCFNGDCNLGITIRSVHVKGSESIVRAGAGIISLSDPYSELKETSLKMEKSLEVL
ncbi:MAG: anthranilate synthase component I family protein [Candidatus Woesearchaeota archaeon]